MKRDLVLDNLLRKAAADPHVIGLAGGLPSPDRFPRRALAASFERVLHQRGAPALQYAWPEGLDRLRERIVERLRHRGARVPVEDVIVTSGAQQAITIAAQLLLRRGGRIGVDAQTYPAALNMFRRAGLIPSANAPARVAYVMPAIGNPRGVGMTAKERRAVMARCRWIIEDDAYGDLRFDGKAPPPLLGSARDRIFYVGTFSKTLSPGLRVGYLVAPARFRKRALGKKQDDDLQANSLAQSIVEDYLAHNPFDDFVAGLRRHYARRARRLMEAVRRHLPSWRFDVPQGGFGLWIDTDARVDEARLLARSIKAGVSFDPGSWFCTQPNRGITQMRLCFSAAPEDALGEGVRRLARVWRRLTTVRRSEHRAGHRARGR